MPEHTADEQKTCLRCGTWIRPLTDRKLCRHCEEPMSCPDCKIVDVSPDEYVHLKIAFCPLHAAAPALLAALKNILAHFTPEHLSVTAGEPSVGEMAVEAIALAEPTGGGGRG